MPMVVTELKLAALSAALLRGPWPKTDTLPASRLWSDNKPTVVFAIRRMG